MLLLAVVNDIVTRREIEDLQKAAAGATRYLEASLQNAEVAQTLGMTDALVARWRRKNAEVTALQQPTAARTVAMAALTRTVRQAVQVLMLALGAWLVISGEASAGVMIATTTLLGRALAPVEQVVGSWRILAEGRAAFRRLGELLRSADAEPQRMALPAPSGRLLAHNLLFRAPQGERMLLAGVSLQLEAGESLAIIGASGAGKSTLVRVLSGVWKPSAGTVRLDQADLAQWPRDELGPWLGYVPQDVELFPGTVAENIARLGEVDAEQVVRAAKRAQAHELILALPEGYDTVVDAHSAVISPGQRQRIALARALYGDPKLVILDEPNSNLDGAGEAALAEALKALRGQVTVVVVTHRSTLIQHVDKVLVLDAARPSITGRPPKSCARCSRRPRRRRWRAGRDDAGARGPCARARQRGARGEGLVSAAVLPSVAADAPLAQQLADARRLARRGALVLAVGVLPVAAWLAMAPLSTAVVASSFVKVDLDRRVVQHAEGGTVREVKVRDGQHVEQGEALLVLDDVAVDADMNRLDYRVAVERASLARLEAEQLSAAALRFPDDVVAAAGSDPRVAEQLVKERALFGARRDALVGQSALLRAQQAKVAQEAGALRAQIAQASESLRHQKDELETNRRLLNDGFISTTRISQLEATVADYGVKLEEKRSELARAEQKMLDADLRIKSLEGDYRQQASDQLKVSAAKLAELQQERRKTSTRHAGR
jgi:PrtD family type I secretion system ABC transporter